MKTIKINAIQFTDHCGKDHSKLMLWDDQNYQIGEPVKLQVWSTSDDKPTGAFIIRYVEDIISQDFPDFTDLFLVLSLCAFKPTESYILKPGF
jgi:hypothetical protein